MVLIMTFIGNRESFLTGFTLLESITLSRVCGVYFVSSYEKGNCRPDTQTGPRIAERQNQVLHLTSFAKGSLYLYFPTKNVEKHK